MSVEKFLRPRRSIVTMSAQKTDASTLLQARVGLKQIVLGVRRRELLALEVRAMEVAIVSKLQNALMEQITMEMGL
jgi:hypothetical protein